MPVQKFAGQSVARVDEKGDGSFVPVVQLETGAPVVTSADREVVETIFYVKTAFPGASVGDKIVKSRSLDVTQASPTTIWTQWHNDSTGLDLATAPNVANLADKPLFRTIAAVVNVGASYGTTSGCASVTVVPQPTTTAYSVNGVVFAGSKVFGQDGAGSFLASLAITNVAGSYVTVMEVRP